MERPWNSIILQKWKSLFHQLMHHFLTLQWTIAQSLAAGHKLILPSVTQLRCLHPVNSRKLSANKYGKFVHCLKCKLRVSYEKPVKAEDKDKDHPPPKTESQNSPLPRLVKTESETTSQDSPGASSSQETTSQIAALTQQITILTDQLVQTRQNQDVMGAFLQTMMHHQPQVGAFPDYQDEEATQWYQMDIEDEESR